MDDGFNMDFRETQDANEFSETECNADFSGYYTNVISENNEIPKKKTKKKASVIVIVLALVVLTLTTVPEAVAESNVKAEINCLTVTDTTISYNVAVEEGENLTVIVYNEFMRREENLSVGGNEGTFTGLKPGMSYTVAVVGDFGMGERSIVKKRVKTERH